GERLDRLRPDDVIHRCRHVHSTATGANSHDPTGEIEGDDRVALSADLARHADRVDHEPGFDLAGDIAGQRNHRGATLRRWTLCKVLDEWNRERWRQPAIRDKGADRVRADSHRG